MPCAYPMMELLWWLPVLVLLLGVMGGGSAVSADGRDGAGPGDKADRPGRVWVVAQQDGSASDENAGTAAAPLATIGRAAELAEPGDTVRVHAGLYREWVRPARGGTAERPIRYEAAAGQRVIVSGAEPWRADWRPVPGHAGLFEASLGELSGGPFRRLIRDSRGGGTQGMLILDDRPLPEAISLEALRSTPGAWLSINGRDLWLHWAEDEAPPAEGWQVTTRGRLFAGQRRGLDHVHISGLTFQHAGNDASFPQVGAVSTRSGRGWVIEDCVIRWNKTVGLDCGQETPPSARHNLPNLHRDQDHDDWNPGGHLIQRNHIHDNGQCGIAGYRSPGTRVRHNRVERNGHAIPGFETAGIKFHFLDRGIIEDNLVLDNRGPGIWLDTGYAGATVQRNVAVGNEVAGVMVELGHGHVAVTGNVLLANQGAGLYSHDASDVLLTRNLIARNGRFGVMFRLATDRGYKHDGRRIERCEAARNRVVGNTLIANAEGEIGLPADLPRQHGNHADRNLLVPAPGREARFELSAPPALRGLDAAQRQRVLSQINRDGGAELDLADLDALGDGLERIGWADWRQRGGHGQGSVLLDADAWPLRFDREALTIRLPGPPPTTPEPAGPEAEAPWPARLSQAFGQGLALTPTHVPEP